MCEFAQETACADTQPPDRTTIIIRHGGDRRHHTADTCDFSQCQPSVEPRVVGGGFIIACFWESYCLTLSHGSSVPSMQQQVKSLQTQFQHLHLHLCATSAVVCTFQVSPIRFWCCVVGCLSWRADFLITAIKPHFNDTSSC